MVTGIPRSGGNGKLQALTPAVCQGLSSCYLKQVGSCNDHDRGAWLPASKTDRYSREQVVWKTGLPVTFNVI